MLLFLYGAHHTVTNPDKHWLEWKSVTINPVDYFRLILHWKALNLYLALALQYTSQFVYSLMVLYMPRFFTEHQSQNTPAKYDLECLTQRAFRLIVLPASYESYNYPILLEGNILIKKISHMGSVSTYEYINHLGAKHPIMKLSRSNFVMYGHVYNLRDLFGDLTECPVVGHGEQLPQGAVKKRNSSLSIKLLCTAIKFDFPEALDPVIEDPNPLMFHMEI